MGNSAVEISVAAGVAEIVLKRPESLNAIDRETAIALLDALQSAATDAQVRALLLRGEGRAFCAGQDIDEILNDPKKPVDLGEILEKRYNPIVRTIRYVEKPVVCAVNGIAAGAGANLALACDFVIAGEDAVFVQAFSKIGLMPDSSGTFFLPRLVGVARATALMMLGEKLTAAEAERIGLIYRVVPNDSLLKEARALTARLAESATFALGLTKRALNYSFTNDLESQLDLERDLQSRAGDSEDFVEGMTAFKEKRPPRFRGKAPRGRES